MRLFAVSADALMAVANASASVRGPFTQRARISSYTVVTAISLAISPAAAPPNPSATMNSVPRGPTTCVRTSACSDALSADRSTTMKASSLCSRVRPTSVRPNTWTTTSPRAASGWEGTGIVTRRGAGLGAGSLAVLIEHEGNTFGVGRAARVAQAAQYRTRALPGLGGVGHVGALEQGLADVVERGHAVVAGRQGLEGARQDDERAIGLLALDQVCRAVHGGLGAGGVERAGEIAVGGRRRRRPGGRCVRQRHRRRTRAGRRRVGSRRRGIRPRRRPLNRGRLYRRRRHRRRRRRPGDVTLLGRVRCLLRRRLGGRRRDARLRELLHGRRLRRIGGA